MYRSSTSGGPYTQVNPSLVTTTSYTDSGLADGRTYYYVLEAVNSSATASANSTEVSATPVDRTPPSAPSNLSATAGSTQVSLTWSAATDNVSVTGYRVYRNGSQVIQTTSATYVDSGLTNGTTYSYYVLAYDAAGNVSVASNTASATPVAVAPTALTKSASGVNRSSAMLNGEVGPNGQVTSWWYDYGRTSGYGASRAAQSLSASTSLVSTANQVSGLSSRTTYHYRLVAKWSNGTTTNGADQRFTTPKH